MASRRKYGNPRSSAPDEYGSQPDADGPSSRPSLAAQAIRASSVHRDSSLSSAYGEIAFSSVCSESSSRRSDSTPQASSTYEYTSKKNFPESKYGFWGVLARKAKSVLDHDDATQQHGNCNTGNHPHSREASTDDQLRCSNHLPEAHCRSEGPKSQKGLDVIVSSLNYIGGKVGNALEEGFSVVESRTADIIQESRKLNIRKKRSSSNSQSQSAHSYTHQHRPSHVQADQETQLKAARDVANAMAAKAKLLMRELKTVKADLTFAKERCGQLEEENRILRESCERGGHPEDDDLIRLQLETLLAEKARLAHENSVHARENRFLREIVEYHQLTMQDVVYLDEGREEVTEVYPISMSNLYVARGTISGSATPWISPRDNESASLPVPVPPAAATKLSVLQPLSK